MNKTNVLLLLKIILLLVLALIAFFWLGAYAEFCVNVVSDVGNLIPIEASVYMESGVLKKREDMLFICFVTDFLLVYLVNCFLTSSRYQDSLLALSKNKDDPKLQQRTEDCLLRLEVVIKNWIKFQMLLSLFLLLLRLPLPPI